MRKNSLLLLLVLAACSASGQPPSSPSTDGSASSDGKPSDTMPGGADGSDTAPANSLKGATIEVTREVGVVFTDGNLYNNSSAIKLRLNLSRGRIFEVAGGPDTPNTAQHPGVTTKMLSADKNTLVLYTYQGKMLDTGDGRKPTAEEFSVTIRNLDVRRP
jgi:hypothetical protein